MTNNRGQRNRLGMVQARVPGVDGANQPLDQWQDVFSRWGEARTSSGMASVRSSEQGVPVAPSRYSWRINYTPQGIDEGMRYVVNGTIFNILEVRHDFAGREFTDLVCDLGANRG